MNENLLTFVHHYRDVFEEFMRIKFKGRRVKYLPENVDLFCKMLELKDDGCSNEEIRDVLKVQSSEDPKVGKSDDLSFCPSDDLDFDPSMQRSISASGCLSDALTVSPSEQPSDCLRVSLSDGISDGRTISPSIGLDDELTDPPTDRLTDDTIRELITDTHTRIDTMYEQIHVANNNLHAFSQEIEHALQKMATQTNIAITALCEASQDMRKGVQSVDTRLAQLENDLDMEKAEDLDLYHVDAGDYQVSLPELTPPMLPGQETEPEDDLAGVRNSIEDGKPDRDLLVAWVKSKRDEESSQVSSYNALASILNEGGIPTLSGRDNWSRSTLRNLVVRSQTEAVEKGDQE